MEKHEQIQDMFFDQIEESLFRQLSKGYPIVQPEIVGQLREQLGKGLTNNLYGYLKNELVIISNID